MSSFDTMADVHAAWLNAGARGDVSTMRHLMTRFPEWIDLQRQVEPPASDTTSQRQARFCSWTGFHLPTLGASTLHTAAWEGSLDVVQFLLESGQSPDTRDDSAMTPMMTAITHLNVMTMRCVFLNGDLVRRNIVVDRRKEEDHQRQKVIAVINLLLRFQADVDAQSEDGKTALHYATSDDAFDVANILLDANATLDIPEETGKTALHLCIQEGGLLVTNLLLSRGANIDVEDFAGRTPLTLMLQRSNVNVLQILLNHHHLVATPHRHDFAGELLMQAVDLQAEAVVRFIVENKYTSSTVKNAAGETPLHRAILKHSPAFMEVLADLDPTGNILIDVTLTSETPAHYAARYGSVLEVETLLNCMASAFGELEFLNPTNPVNAVDQNGVTPLYLAGTIACGSNNNADQSRIGTEAAAGIMESRHGKVQLFLQHGARLFPPGVLVNELSPRDADLTTNGPRLTLPIQVQTCLKIWLTENTAHIGEPEDDETALQISNDTSFEALTTLCAHWVATVACVGYWASCLPIIIGAGYSHEIVPLLVGLPLCRSSFSILLSQLETYASRHPQRALVLQLQSELQQAWHKVDAEKLAKACI